MIHNHYGYGLRNDEKPFAHKIPPGGNWRDLSHEEKLIYWNGKIPTEGGSTNGLHRAAWDEPARTITTTPLQKLSCQLHPGTLEDDEMTTKKPLLDSLPKLAPNGFTAVSLFSGGGLLDLGAIHAGLQVVWANDFEKSPCVAYAHNIGQHIVQGDITKIPNDSIPDADFVIGGPPCQDYSAAGKGAGEDGERGKLVWRYLEIIQAKQPKAFLFENVKGLIQKKHRHTFDALLQKFDEIGYNVSWKLCNAWDYGVAQKRERVFIVGIRKDLGITYHFPQSEYETTGYHPVIRDAIGDLPEPFMNHEPEKELPAYIQNVVDGKTSTNFGQGIPVNDGSQPAKTLLATYRSKCPMEVYQPPYNHTDKPLTEAVYKHAKEHNIGYNASPASTIRTKGEDVADFANHSEKDYWTPKSEYTYDQANRVQNMDEPSNTILAHHNSGQPIHPTQKPRRFTVRECLRLQSVPDSYVFPEFMPNEKITVTAAPHNIFDKLLQKVGVKKPKRIEKQKSFSLSAMYKCVGNGVPSRLAYHLIKALCEQLQGVVYPGVDQMKLEL